MTEKYVITLYMQSLYFPNCQLKSTGKNEPLMIKAYFKRRDAEDTDVKESLLHCFIATLLKTFKPGKAGKDRKDRNYRKGREEVTISLKPYAHNSCSTKKIVARSTFDASRSK